MKKISTLFTVIALTTIACEHDASLSCIKPAGSIREDRVNFTVANGTGKPLENLSFKSSNGDYEPQFSSVFTGWMYAGGPDFAPALAYIQDIEFQIDGIVYHTGSDIPMQEGLGFELGGAYVVAIKEVFPDDGSVEAEILLWTGEICNDNPDGRPYGSFAPVAPNPG